jgi:hypothetical protein
MKFCVVLFAVLAVGAFVLSAPISAGAQSTPTAAVRAFYKWYIHALVKDVAEPLKSDKAMARKYVTASFLRRIEKASAREEGLNADPFLSAQDWDKAWENNIVIKKVSTTGATTTINAVLPSKQMGDQKLKIIMKKEAGRWKIDQVNDRNI